MKIAAIHKTISTPHSRGLLKYLAILIGVIGSILSASASTLTVTSNADSGAGSLRAAIATVDANPDTSYDIVFSGVSSVTLTTGPLLITSNSTVTVNTGGTAVTIDGGHTTGTTGSQVFFVNSGTVSLSNLTIQNSDAQGGAGGTGNQGGGGGLGAGGALFVGPTANVTISSVTFTNNQATGGAGGDGLNIPEAGGGGGLGGNGASSASNSSGGGGGGGALPGQDGNLPVDPVGGSGGGPNGGAGGNNASGSAGGALSGGGGGGGNSSGNNPNAGGAGGFGGGGGGSALIQVSSAGAFGGQGGFGGGGGGSDGNETDNGGNGGFGGGGGGSFDAAGGIGGYDAGNGIGWGGGGGAALGGAVFVTQGGILTIQNSGESGSAVTGGIGGTNDAGSDTAGNGTGAGAGYFLQGTSALNYSATSGSYTISDAISSDGLDGGINKSGIGTLILSGSNSYTGGTTISAGILEADTNNALGTGAVTVNAGTTLNVGANVSLANNITISGTGSTGQGALYSIGSTLSNQAISGTVTLAADASVADSGANGSVFNLSDIQLGSHTLTAAAGEVIFGGAISGSGGLIIATPEAAIDGGDNTFTGLTDVLGGATLNLQDAGNTAISGDLTIENTAGVEVRASNQFSSNTVVTLNGSGELDFNIASGPLSETIAGLQGTSANAVVIVNGGESGGAQLTLDGTGNYSYAGQITDGGLFYALTLIMSGTGTQTLSGTNVYTGGTVLNAGTLSVSADHNLGEMDATLAFNGGTLEVTGTGFSSERNTTLNTTGTFQVDTGTLALSGNITGTGVLIKTGAGELSLSGSSNYSGGTTVSAGVLQAASSTALGTGTVTVYSGSTLDIVGNTTLANNVTISGTGTSGQGALFSSSDSPTLSGTLILAANASVGDGGPNSGFSLHNIQLNDYTLTVATGSVDFGGNISGSGGLTIAAQGYTFIGGGQNSFTGLTDVLGGANLQLQNSGHTSISGDLTIEDGGYVTDVHSGQLSHTTVVTLNGNGEFEYYIDGHAVSDTIAGLQGSSGSSQFVAFLVSIPGSVTLTLDGTGSYSYAGQISDDPQAPLTLIMDGTGTQVLSGGNDYEGGTVFDAGTLSVSGGNNLGNSSGGLTFNGGTLEVTGAGFSNSSDVTINTTGTFLTDTGTLALSGNITGTGVLIKTGAGLLSLSGSSSYSGGTIIDSGIVEADSNTALGTGAVTVNNGTTLDVTGDITLANDITISGTGTTAQGAIFSFGSANQVETISGTVALAADASVGDGPTSQLHLGSTQLGSHTLTVASGIVHFMGGITGSGGLIVAGIANINGGTNSFTGLTVVQNGGMLELNDTDGPALKSNLTIESGGSARLGVDNQFSSNSVVTINGTGVLALNLSHAPQLETIAGLQSNSTAAMVVAGGISTLPAILTLDGTGNYVYAGQITNRTNAPLSLNKSGTGTQTLSGSNSFTGGTTLTAGALVVGSSNALGTGDVTVNGGTLSTDGTIRTINVGGNYIQGDNGTLQLNLYSADDYDSVQLTGSGTITLAGTLALNLTGDFSPGSGESFALMTSGTTVSGSFTTVTTNLPTIGANLDYTNDVTLLFQNPFATQPGLNPNQTSVATYIDTFDKHITNPGFTALVGGLNSVSGDPSTLAGAFNQLMPLNFANFASSNAFNNASFTIGQFDSYFANHRGADGTFVSSNGGIDYTGLAINSPNIDPALQSVTSRLLAWSPAPSTGLLSDSSSLVSGGMDMKNVTDNISQSNPWNVFVTGNVVLAQDFSDPSASLPYNSSTTGAVQLGADYKITPHLLVGATFGYGHTNATLDTIGSSANVNTYSPGVYMSYANSGWYYNALGSYGFTDYSQDRNVNIGAFSGTAHSSPGGSQVIGNLDGGYDFHKGNWTFGPTLGLGYTHLNIDGYTETGLPGADLTVNQDKSNSLRSRVGGQVSYAVKSGDLIFTPHLSASWQHEFMDQSRGITSQFSDVGAGSFVVNTANPSRDSALADLGLDAQVTNKLTVFTDYSVQVGQSNYFGQSVQAGVKIGF